MTREQLLVEIDDILRTAPPSNALRNETEWLGRLAAALDRWDSSRSASLQRHLEGLTGRSVEVHASIHAIETMLHQARHALRLELAVPTSGVFAQGLVFDYFDELRKIIETARQGVFFVDPYLDTDVVSRYLGHVPTGVPIRLLGRERLPTLIPGVDLFARQAQRSVELRSAPGFHDRWLFIDRSACYQSGASFKDVQKRPLQP